MTRKEALKKYPSNMVMVTREFNSEIFIAPLKGGKIQVTDNKNEAEKWSELDGSKLGYHKAVTGYKELKFEQI
jgi:hypothetical protein